MSRPVIGVTVSEIRRSEDAQRVRHGEPTQTEMTLGLSYMRAVEMAGGLPVALPPLSSENVDALVDHLCGLLLSGGPDIDPSSYGAVPHPELGPIDPVVDAFEIALCRHAYRRRLAILGICRGAQLLNVARRGTLHQHVPDVTNATIEHRQSEIGTRTSHEVRVAPDSSLAQTTGGGPVSVNSFHHQAVDRVGFDLRPVAWSQDGLIEAIEAQDGRFALGVQWHAETLVADAVHASLFERLVEAATRPVRAAPRERRRPTAPRM
ncbi:MAG TPA: gamma-glutamyl-gamma-aminobutyrate hydrolase family protein [Solirubrobacteraceae bacterium]|nr:gamma-glutamyl-gamma-aminobutyrate hydrolase family protein [Solirubrobacteraceae bacterium]